jgi:hypothetical protein
MYGTDVSEPTPSLIMAYFHTLVFKADCRRHCNLLPRLYSLASDTLKHEVLQCTVRRTQYTVHGTQYMVHTVYYTVTVHSTRFTVHGTQYTVHSTRYTVHSTQCTVHGTLCKSTHYSCHYRPRL